MVDMRLISTRAYNRRQMRIVLVAHRERETNLRLVEAAPRDVPFEMLSPDPRGRNARPGDAALARLDVLATVDGIEPGVWEIARLEAEGVHVLNAARRCSRPTTSS